jgi:hypothetical protein
MGQVLDMVFIEIPEHYEIKLLAEVRDGRKPARIEPQSAIHHHPRTVWAGNDAAAAVTDVEDVDLHHAAFLVG